jgi:hypothetical protein
MILLHKNFLEIIKLIKNNLIRFFYKDLFFNLFCKTHSQFENF